MHRCWHKGINGYTLLARSCALARLSFSSHCLSLLYLTRQGMQCNFWIWDTVSSVSSSLTVTFPSRRQSCQPHPKGKPTWRKSRTSGGNLKPYFCSTSLSSSMVKPGSMSSHRMKAWTFRMMSLGSSKISCNWISPERPQVGRRVPSCQMKSKNNQICPHLSFLDDLFFDVCLLM